MRDAFFDELLGLFQRDARVVFLTGDLGYKLFDPLRAVAPDRVIDFGIREAGMVGFAAGLAKTGMIPFVYSIVPFITLRCLEQVKLDVCYNGARVILVGVGGGFAYGPNGPTHHGVDDLGVLSCLPGLRLWTPADPAEVRACVRQAPGLDGPAYLRLGRRGEPTLRDTPMPDIDRPVTLREGGDVVVFSCGVITHEALAAADALAKEGIQPRVVHLPTFRPFPEGDVEEILREGLPVVTVEEHMAPGGLGREVAVLMAKIGCRAPFRALHIPARFPKTSMERETSLAWAGIAPADIAKACRTASGQQGA